MRENQSSKESTLQPTQPSPNTPEVDDQRTILTRRHFLQQSGLALTLGVVPAILTGCGGSGGGQVGPPPVQHNVWLLGNSFQSDGSRLKQQTPTGGLIPGPDLTELTEAFASSVSVDQTGRFVGMVLYDYEPLLTVYDTQNGTVRQKRIENWGTFLSTTTIATSAHSVFISSYLGNDNRPLFRGLYRLSLTDLNSVEPFASGKNYYRLRMGWDGNLYALAFESLTTNLDKTRVDIYNPETLALVRSLVITGFVWDIGALPSGDIYLIKEGGFRQQEHDPAIYHYTAGGRLVYRRVLRPEVQRVITITLTPEGAIVCGISIYPSFGVFGGYIQHILFTDVRNTLQNVFPNDIHTIDLIHVPT